MFSEEAHIMEMPREGDYIAIQSYKHNARYIEIGVTLWWLKQSRILLSALMIEL